MFVNSARPERRGRFAFLDIYQRPEPEEAAGLSYALLIPIGPSLPSNPSRAIMLNRRSAAGDVLYGCKAISAYLGLTPRQALFLIETDRLPHWREGRAILARRSSLDTWVAEREVTARVRAPAA